VLATGSFFNKEKIVLELLIRLYKWKCEPPPPEVPIPDWLPFPIPEAFPLPHPARYVPFSGYQPGPAGGRFRLPSPAWPDIDPGTVRRGVLVGGAIVVGVLIVKKIVGAALLPTPAAPVGVALLVTP